MQLRYAPACIPPMPGTASCQAFPLSITLFGYAVGLFGWRSFFVGDAALLACTLALALPHVPALRPQARPRYLSLVASLGRRAINLLAPEARGRLNGLYTGLFFIGSAIGAAVAGPAFAHAGWLGVCVLTAVFFIGAALVHRVFLHEHHAA